MDNQNKKCHKCEIEKNITEFYKDTKRKDGVKDHCKECDKEYRKQYRLNNKQKIYETNKIYRQSPKGKEVAKKYEQSPHGTLSNRLNNKKYYLKNRFKCIISKGIKKALDISTRSKTIFEALGYTVDDLRCHLESKFTEGMSWDNYGEWHIDHIIPQSWLPFESLEDENFKRCWSLSNLQPLWAKDNCSKGNKYIG